MAQNKFIIYTDKLAKRLEGIYSVISTGTTMTFTM